MSRITIQRREAKRKKGEANNIDKQKHKEGEMKGSNNKAGESDRSKNQ